MKKMKQCKICSKEIAANVKRCPACGGKNKKALYKRPWFIVIVLFVIIGIAVSGEENESSEGLASNGVETTVQADNTGAQTDNTEKTESVPTEYKNALKKAKIYSDTMHMSKAGIYNQLTSEYGEQFPAEAAQYAIDNVEADWKENALKKAKTYQDSMAMSTSAIYDQLISEYGEQFTPEEAQYAIDNLE
ncbi:MAG: Ltp family lipoprotein [Clostridium celatum]|nr:Ltp family lipoprotein [Clostridium celatum]